MSGILPRVARLSGVFGGVLCVIAFGTRCAHVEPPSGGPADTTPPAVAAVYPAPSAVNVPEDARAVFQFNEWIDRNGARGAVMVSPPYAGRLRIEVQGDRVSVLPPGGQELRPGTTHAITVLGTLKDLRGNPMGRAFTLRFSTGAALDSASMTGKLSIGSRRGNLVAALYHGGSRSGAAPVVPVALSPRDTGFRAGPLPEPWRELPAYLAAADSSGGFRLDGAAPGSYAVFAFEDINGNFAFDMGFEAAGTGDPAVTLGAPISPTQNLRLAPLDTMPLRIAEAAFENTLDVAVLTGAPIDSLSGGKVPEAAPASALTGVVRVKFSRAPHPVLAAEPSRYRVLPDSGEPVPVSGVAWDPAGGAWILETLPLRANRRHRLEVRGRPDFPGRIDPGAADTSAVFVPAAAPAASAEAKAKAWSVIPLRPAAAAGPSGLPSAAQSPATGAAPAFISSAPLVPDLWDALRARLVVFVGKDTMPASHRVSRRDISTFALDLSRPLKAGDALILKLRPPAGDSTPSRVLYAGTVADSLQTGGVRLRVPASRPDWKYLLSPLSAGGGEEHGLMRVGDSLKADGVPIGRYGLNAFQDRNGDGVWDAGSLKPWVPQEPFETVLDSVAVSPGKVTDATEE